MRVFRVLACWAAGAAGFAATEIPAITPQVSSLFPHGGQRGAEVAVEMRGSYLADAARLEFPDGQLQAAIESSGFRQVRARVRIAADAEAGLHEFRLVTPRGVYLGVFHVGSLPETQEVESNDTPEHAQRLTLPALVNGRADGNDADYFKFQAQAGQTIVFDVMAARFGSALDPVLTLFDSHEREIAYCDDAYTFKDARLAHRFERAGEYTLLVSASFERSGKDAEYRLLATSGPYPVSALPLGGQRGRETEVTVRGWNLAGIDRVWLGKGEAHGEVVSRTADQVRFRVKIPDGMRPGSYALHFGTGGTQVPVPVRFEVSDLPEVTLPAGTLVKVSAPVVVNGRIGDPGERLRRAADFEIEAEAGARYEFAVEGWGLGEPIDPVITLFDPGGRKLIQEDDPAPNSFIHHPATHDPRMTWVFAEGGCHRVQVRDAAYEAGGGFRVTVRRTEPGFEVDVRSPQLTVFRGKTGRLPAVVRRTGGVHVVEAFRKPDSEIEHFRIVEKDGWQKPIRVWVEGLPGGIRAEAVEAEARNTAFKGNDGEELFVDGTLVEIPVHVPAETNPGRYEMVVRARGTQGDRTVERQGRVLYGSGRALRGVATREQKLWLNVLDAPPVIWNAPAEFWLSQGSTDRLKVGVVRVDGDFPIEIVPKRTAPGWAVGVGLAAAGAEEVEVPVTALAQGAGEAAQLVLVARIHAGGRVRVVESPPIELKVRP